MLREERKWRHMKCPVKASKCRKRVEDQRKKEKGTKNKNNEWKTVTPVVDTNPAVSVITLNSGGPNEPIKR